MSEEYYDYVCKIVIVGESGVGKTNILSRFIKNEFNHNSLSTLGVEFGTKVNIQNGKKIRMQIWDTAGQERYRAITNSYYINAKGGLVVYDICYRASFDNVDRWVKELRNVAGSDVCIILIGNKCDKEDQREVSVEEGMNKAKDLDLITHFETSALSNINIENTFNLLTVSKCF
jgi:small GTP-binding protein